MNMIDELKSDLDDLLYITKFVTETDEIKKLRKKIKKMKEKFEKGNFQKYL